MHARARIGRHGERHAERFLAQSGYRSSARNVRTPFGEIDLIMWDGTCLVFIEVKLRRTLRFGPPETAVTPQKLVRIQRAIAFVIARRRWVGPYRLDIVAISHRRRAVDIAHFQNCAVGV